MKLRSELNLKARCPENLIGMRKAHLSAAWTAAITLVLLGKFSGFSSIWVLVLALGFVLALISSVLDVRDISRELKTRRAV